MGIQPIYTKICLSGTWRYADLSGPNSRVVVEADVRPKMVMNAFKSYARRALNRLGNDEPDRKRWARHGSTQWLWKDEDAQGAIRYVVSGQGEPMEVYLGDLL